MRTILSIFPRFTNKEQMWVLIVCLLFCFFCLLSCCSPSLSLNFLSLKYLPRVLTNQFCFLKTVKVKVIYSNAVLIIFKHLYIHESYKDAKHLEGSFHFHSSIWHTQTGQVLYEDNKNKAVYNEERTYY